jgi:hypothetical protein
MGHQALHTLKQNSQNPKKYAMANYIAIFLNTYISEHSYELALTQKPSILNHIKNIKLEKEKYFVEDVNFLLKYIDTLLDKKFIVDKNKQKEVDQALLMMLTNSIRYFDNL